MPNHFNLRVQQDEEEDQDQIQQVCSVITTTIPEIDDHHVLGGHVSLSVSPISSWTRLFDTRMFAVYVSTLPLVIVFFLLNLCTRNELLECINQ